VTTRSHKLDESISTVSDAALSRRRALQGIGALAVTQAVFGAAGCSKEALSSSGDDAPETDTSARADSTTAGSTAAGGPGAQDTPPIAGNSANTAPTAGNATAGASAATDASTAGTGGAGQSTAGDGAGANAGSDATPAAGSGGIATSNAAAGGGGQPSAGNGAMGSDKPDFMPLDCVATPEMTEGPFFVDEKLERADLLAGEESNVTSGLPLELTLGIFTVDGDACTPLAGATVDIWHADVEGIYSDVASSFFQQTATTGRQFLRAYQVTDEGGLVKFNTIYPGWYGSRTIHIHFKIRVLGPSDNTYTFTSQMYFDEEINDAVMGMGAYNTRGERMVLNSTDQVYKDTGPGAGPDPNPLPAGQKAPGDSTLVTCVENTSGSGYNAHLKIGLMMA
jgi:protocatechuate 3,4-dioxygenase beta subunit